LSHAGGDTPTTGHGAAHTKLEFEGSVTGIAQDHARWDVHFYRGEIELLAKVEPHFPDPNTTYLVEAYGKVRYFSSTTQGAGSDPVQLNQSKALVLIPEQVEKKWPEDDPDGNPMPNNLNLGPEPGETSRMFRFEKRLQIKFEYEVTANGNISTNREEPVFISESEVIDKVPGEDRVSGHVILWDIEDSANPVEVQRYILK
jgi:hypothetical protein